MKTLSSHITTDSDKNNGLSKIDEIENSSFGEKSFIPFGRVKNNATNMSQFVKSSQNFDNEGKVSNDVTSQDMSSMRETSPIMRNNFFSTTTRDLTIRLNMT